VSVKWLPTSEFLQICTLELTTVHIDANVLHLIHADVLFCRHFPVVFSALYDF
jgi:hypothetical protein